MKVVLAVVVAVVAALLAVSYLTTGEVRLLPRNVPEEERAVRQLEVRFEQARREFTAAAKAAGATGAELTAEAEAARKKVEGVKAELDSLVDRLRRDAGEAGREARRKAREKADRLQAAIEAFKRELR